MKCVCGYETGYDYEKEEESGYEKFVRLNVIFLTPEQQVLQVLCTRSTLWVSG